MMAEPGYTPARPLRVSMTPEFYAAALASEYWELPQAERRQVHAEAELSREVRASRRFSEIGPPVLLATTLSLGRH